MSLPPLKFMLDSQLSRCERDFKNALTLTSPDQRPLKIHHLEGAISDAWQAYCRFVRYLLIRSACGGTTAKGVVLPASVVPPTWERVSYIGLRASRGNAVQPGTTNALIWKEPTWGDDAKIVNIVNALAPTNANNLKNYLAGGLTGPKHCQIVRNACAHQNIQTKATVNSLASMYVASALRHPTDAMMWRDSTTHEFAFLTWLDDMKAIAEGAVQ